MATLTSSILSRPELVSGNTEQTRPGNNLYFPALDGIRAMAFLLVFGAHYFQMPFGFTGVDAFFVLSGFLITGILCDTIDHPHPIRNFYIRRALRIFPLFYAVVLLVILLDPIFHWQWQRNWIVWPLYMGNLIHYLHRAEPGWPFQRVADAQLLSLRFPLITLYFGHFWSLCVEEQFYLVWPWVVFGVRDRRKLMWICLAAVIGCPILRATATHVLPAYMVTTQFNAIYVLTPFRIDALLLGGLLALIRRGPHARRLALAARYVFVILAALFLLWFVRDSRILETFRQYTHPLWIFTWGLTLIDLFFASVIVMALEANSVAFRVFDIGVLRWLGRISYGAYIFHDIYHAPIALLGVKYWEHAKAATACLAFLLTLLLAWASFRWFESPFIRLKERWTR